MNTLDALTALRKLDALPLPRRQYLCALVATAPTDADRTRIVVTAKRENIDKRWSTEQALKAELDARHTGALATSQKPAEGAQKPSRRMERTDETTPAHRPVTVRFIEPTKVAKIKPLRAEGIGTNRVYEDAPKPEPRSKPIPHGTTTGYAKYRCRCEPCRAAKARSRKGQGKKRRANGEPAPHGTTTNYSRGCRCQPCRDAVSAHARKKYAENKLLGK